MSEKNLQSLIETIKSEGIEVADKKAAQIILEAEKKAALIIETAKNNRKNIIEEAEKEAKSISEKGNNALKQAARDITISLKNDIKKIFEHLLKNTVQNHFSDDIVKNSILQILQQIGSDSELILPENQLQEIKAFIHKKLQNESGIPKISSDKSIIDGFAIQNTKEGWTYKITSTEIAELLNRYLGSHWKEILTK